jgi:hypothetical protein
VVLKHKKAASKPLCTVILGNFVHFQCTAATEKDGIHCTYQSVGSMLLSLQVAPRRYTKLKAHTQRAHLVYRQ